VKEGLKPVKPTRSNYFSAAPQDRWCHFCFHRHKVNVPCTAVGKCFKTFNGRYCEGCSRARWAMEKETPEKLEGPAASKPVSQETIRSALMYLWNGQMCIGTGVLLKIGGNSDPIRYYANTHNVKAATGMSFGNLTNVVPILKEKWSVGHASDLSSISSALVGKYMEQGTKPLPVVRAEVTDVPQVAMWYGLDPETRTEFQVSPGSYIVRNNEIFHNFATAKGSCGSILVAPGGGVLGIHWREKTMNPEYPNAAIPIIDLKV